jgi:DNA-binding LacI/PurR family transcriptional regulator
VLDEEGDDTLTGILPKEPKMLHVAVAYTEQCGLKAGQFLIERGHRSVAYISATHGNPWSKNRLRGLIQAFENAGFSDAVQIYTLDAYENIWSFQHVPDSRFARNKGHFRTLYSGLSGLIRSSDLFLKKKFIMANSEMNQLEAYIKMRNGVSPLVERAILDSPVTAFACANDAIAMMALCNLKKHGKRVPQDISVVGFDDTLDAYHERLSSFNFNMQSTAARMFAHIVMPNARSRMQRSVEIPGYMVERSSSARATKSA